MELFAVKRVTNMNNLSKLICNGKALQLHTFMFSFSCDSVLIHVTIASNICVFIDWIDWFNDLSLPFLDLHQDRMLALPVQN